MANKKSHSNLSWMDAEEAHLRDEIMRHYLEEGMTLYDSIERAMHDLLPGWELLTEEEKHEKTQAIFDIITNE